MKANAIGYCIRSGFKNILHNKLFSAASTATIAACIFLFCLFFAIVTNVQHIAKTAETTVGITVFLPMTQVPRRSMLSARPSRRARR